MTAATSERRRLGDFKFALLKSNQPENWDAFKITPSSEKSKRILAFQDYVTCVIPHKAFHHNSRDIQQRTRLDSNQRPSVSKTDALVNEPLKNKTHLNAAKRESAVVRAVEMESDAQSSPADPDLLAVITSWATLPATIKISIIAMLDATTP